jgi:1-phosphofructokinase family hexose kinase
MIVTVTLHTSVDRALQVDDVEQPAATATVLAERVAGKGVNLSRVLAALGRPSLALGFVGQAERARFEQALATQDIASHWIATDGATRCNLTYLDPRRRRERHERRPGFAVRPADVVAMAESLAQRVGAGDLVVFAGSLPAGLDAARAMDLARVCAARGAHLVFDSGGEVLRQGLALGPQLIAPNQLELAELTGQRPEHPGGLVALVRGLIPPCQQVIVTMGAAGALLVDAQVAWHARVHVDAPVSSVGCGDALLAGFLDARLRGLDDASCLGQGVACGAAAALQPVAGDVDRADVVALAARVQIRAVADSAAA